MCQQSNSILELSKALLAVQSQLQPVLKDANNPFTKSKYATLNSIMEVSRPLLLQHGLLVTQYPCAAPVELGAGYIGLETRITHTESGEWQSNLAVLPLPKADPQGAGSAITYARRYSLCSILGIITEDDDGNACSYVSQNRQTQGKASRQSQPVDTAPKSSMSALPALDGIAYRKARSVDGKAYVVASGATQEKKSVLQAAGFVWDTEHHCWWRYVDEPQQSMA